MTATTAQRSAHDASRRARRRASSPARRSPIGGGRTVGSTIGRLLLFVIYAIPLVWIVATAFKADPDVQADPSSLHFPPTMANFRLVFSDAWPAMINSLQIALGTALVCVVAGTLAAYGLARRRTRAWTVLTSVALGAMIVLQMVPQAMSIIPLYGILAHLHLINTLIGVILADSALLLPFAVLLLRPFFLGVPPALEEAAMVDGASVPRMFWSIVLPLVRNGIATVAVMVFIMSWGEFIYGTTFLSKPDGYPVSAVLAAQSTLYGPQYGRLMALAVLTTLPIVLIFLAGQRRLVDGMLTGAVK